MDRLSQRSMYYTLEGKDVVPASQEAMLRWFGEDNEKRKLGNDWVGDQNVSTVFLVIDHNFGLNGPPVVFETMIFGGPHDERQWRYAGYDEAMAGHARIVEALKNGVEP